MIGDLPVLPLAACVTGRTLTQAGTDSQPAGPDTVITDPRPRHPGESRHASGSVMVTVTPGLTVSLRAVGHSEPSSESRSPRLSPTRSPDLTQSSATVKVLPVAVQRIRGIRVTVPGQWLGAVGEPEPESERLGA
jgi:hypothetical protein